MNLRLKILHRLWRTIFIWWAIIVTLSILNSNCKMGSNNFWRSNLLVRKLNTYFINISWKRRYLGVIQQLCEPNFTQFWHFAYYRLDGWKYGFCYFPISFKVFVCLQPITHNYYVHQIGAGFSGSSINQVDNC